MSDTSLTMLCSKNTSIQLLHSYVSRHVSHIIVQQRHFHQSPTLLHMIPLSSYTETASLIHRLCSLLILFFFFTIYFDSFFENMFNAFLPQAVTNSFWNAQTYIVWMFCQINLLKYFWQAIISITAGMFTTNCRTGWIDFDMTH